MNAKSIVTLALLLFVGVSVAYLVVQQGGSGETRLAGGPEGTESATGDRSQETANASGQPGASSEAPDESAGDPAVETAAEDGSGGQERKVLVYYFHGAKRCTTCRAIESYAREAVDDAFSEELESGRVVWRTVNIDQPENGYFAEKYGLSFSTLVVVRMEGEKEAEWQNLSDVWSLVKGSREEYDAYVRDAVSAYLGG